MLLESLFLFLAFSSAASCPGSLSPSNRCICMTGTGKYDRGLHFVSCSGIYTDLDLSNSLAAFKGITIQKLILQDLVLNFVPQDAFQGLGIKVLDFQSSSIVALSDTDLAFHGLEDSLTTLRFKDCSLTNSWDWSAFKNLVKLTTLSIEGGDLESIEDSLRQLGHLKLKNINFAGTGVSSIDDRAFSDFTELYDLSLKYNMIREFKRSMMPDPADKLFMLSLNNNEIKELPEDLFTNMPKLQYLDLRDNKLLTLKEETFAPVWNQLAMLETSGNKLRCDCRLKWVLAKPRIRQMTVVCDEPLRFRGKQVLELQPADLWC